MLPPEMAMTWYVPASCRRCSTSGSSEPRSPIRIATATAPDCGSRVLTCRDRAVRTDARIADADSANHGPRLDDLHQRGALYATDQRDAASREQELLIGNALIEIARRPRAGPRASERAARAPFSRGLERRGRPPP